MLKKDLHMNVFNTNNIGNVWYVGIENDQRAFSVSDSETGRNQACAGRIDWGSAIEVAECQSDDQWRISWLPTVLFSLLEGLLIG